MQKEDTAQGSLGDGSAFWCDMVAWSSVSCGPVEGFFLGWVRVVVVCVDRWDLLFFLPLHEEEEEEEKDGVSRLSSSSSSLLRRRSQRSLRWRAAARARTIGRIRSSFSLPLLILLFSFFGVGWEERVAFSAVLESGGPPPHTPKQKSSGVSPTAATAMASSTSCTAVTC